MDYSPSAKELSHFPFLKKAQDHIKKSFPPIDQLLKEEKGSLLTGLAVKRINQALASKKTIAAHFPHRDDEEIASYVLSRIIVSCIGDKQLYDRLTRYEAERAYYFLNNETGSENEKGWNEHAIRSMTTRTAGSQTTLPPNSGSISPKTGCPLPITWRSLLSSTRTGSS